MQHKTAVKKEQFERMKAGLTTARLFTKKNSMYYPGEAVDIRLYNSKREVEKLALAEITRCDLIRIDLLMRSVYQKIQLGRNRKIEGTELENLLFDLGYESLHDLINAESYRHFRNDISNLQFMNLYCVYFSNFRII